MTSTPVKHTAGPWVIMGDDTDEGGMPFIQIETKMDPICRVSPAWLPDETEDFQITEQIRANARLIAGAPDMLEALKVAVQLAEQILHGNATPQACAKLIADNSRAALARAQMGAKHRGEIRPKGTIKSAGFPNRHVPMRSR